jgi:hypothetical protein
MRRIVILLLLLTISCDPSHAQSRKKIKKVMDSWLGDTKQALYLSWGPPAVVTSDGSKGEILIYSQRVYNDNTYNFGGNPVRFKQDYYINRMMYVNAEGIVYSWRYDTTPNPPQQVDINLRGTIDVYKR